MIFTPGSSNVTRYFVLTDAFSGEVVTGVDVTTLSMSYTRTRAAAVVVGNCALLGAVDSAHSDGGAVEVDAVNQPGLYRFDFPDAAFAVGADAVQLVITGPDSGTQIAPVYEENELRDLTAQFIRDALTLAPSSGAPGVGSIDDLLENLPAGVLAETVDGITVETLLECIMAVACGEATVLGSVISFKKRDGVTNRIQITVGTTEGERTASTIV